MRITLPAVLNPISRRKDKSVRLSLETRELNPEETLSLMSIEGAEMWVVLSPNEGDTEVPDEDAHIDEKSPSERLKNVLFVWWKQEVEAGKYVGIYENFRRERMEKIIDTIKGKLS